MKLAALNSHHRHRHHLCLRCSIRSGSRPCRHLGSPPGISRAGDTPRNHTMPVDRDGTRPMTRHGRITRLTPRGYHHPSIHDSLLWTVGSLDDINTRLGGLEIRIGEIQNTLNTHVQDTRQWHLQQQQQFVDINALLRQQQEAQAAYWRSMGYNPGP